MVKMSKISDSEYKAYTDNLGLLKGEQKKLVYLVEKAVVGRGDGTHIDELIRKFMNGNDDPNRKMALKNGLLVFTNINMILVQQEGYLRTVVPLEQLGGIGCFVSNEWLTIATVTVNGYEYGFLLSKTDTSSLVQNPNANELTRQIQVFGMEQKSLAQEAPVEICKHCGARNNITSTYCVHCKALLG